MYNLIQLIGMFIGTVFAIFWAKNYDISKWKMLAATIVIQFLEAALILVLTWIENGFTNFGARNAVRVVPFLILIELFAARIFCEDLYKLCDIRAAVIPLVFGISRFACLITPCCGGFYYFRRASIEYAIAQALTGSYQLPLQVFEAVTSLFIYIIIVIYAIKTHFKYTGYAFALFHVLYGSTQFLWEFLHDNIKIITFSPMYSAITSEGKMAFWGISSPAVWSFVSLMVGVIMLIWLRKHPKGCESSKCNQSASTAS